MATPPAPKIPKVPVAHAPARASAKTTTPKAVSNKVPQSAGRVPVTKLNLKAPKATNTKPIKAPR